MNLKEKLARTLFPAAVLSISVGWAAVLFIAVSWWSAANADEDPEAVLLARQVMSGNYVVEATIYPSGMVVRTDSLLYRCNLDRRLSQCWQISGLTDPGASNF